MHINRRLAEQIVAKAQAILKRDLLLADLGGLLLAGSEIPPGTFFTEALSVSQTGHSQTAEHEGKEIKWWPFVYEEQTVAIFGVYVEAGPITAEAMLLLQGLAEVIIYQHFLLDRVQSAEMVRADFIKSTLTSSSLGNVEDLYRQADILQLTLQTPQAVILIEIEGFEQQLNDTNRSLSDEERSLLLAKATEDIASHLRQGFQNFQDNLVAYFGNDRFVLLKGIGGQSLTTLNTVRFMLEKGDYAMEVLNKLQLNHPITIGVGQYYPELQGLRKSYQDAKLALEVGTKVWGRGQTYHIKNVGMFITLANTSQDRKAELAHQILSPLLRDEQLFKTVQAFLASGLNLTDAAAKLHIHRNTLIYRLDKTKKLINLDPRHFDDALQIKLGLMFYQENS
jgi:carbohydrate diacid regulator